MEFSEDADDESAFVAMARATPSAVCLGPMDRRTDVEAPEDENRDFAQIQKRMKNIAIVIGRIGFVTATRNDFQRHTTNSTSEKHIHRLRAIELQITRAHNLYTKPIIKCQIQKRCNIEQQARQRNKDRSEWENPKPQCPLRRRRDFQRQFDIYMRIQVSKEASAMRARNGTQARNIRIGTVKAQ
jgi:hypothetical protein